ncbi:MAG: hypothetical protein K2G63_03335 [Oscillospiraceae bacterium]|nr:hypothetical protein [Oscillospiraceae bacterium]
MNDENLKKGNKDTQFRSGREAVENGRKGGKASGISRNFIGAVKKKLKENPETLDDIVEALITNAKNGDVKSVECLIDLNGESVQRQLAKIKRDELKLKKEALKSSQPETEKEVPHLYKALEATDE